MTQQKFKRSVQHNDPIEGPFYRPLSFLEKFMLTVLCAYFVWLVLGWIREAQL